MVHNTQVIILLLYYYLLDSLYRSTEKIQFFVEKHFFETLSYVHVYRIVYISYRQDTHRIRIDTASDLIVPALISKVGQL